MENFQRLVAVLLHGFDSIIQAARLLHEFNYFLHPVAVAVIVFHVEDNLTLFQLRGLLKGVNQRQRHFLFLNINTNRLANFVGTVIEQIVLYLEGNTYFFTE